MPKLKAYPFPARNPNYTNKEIYYVKSVEKNYIQYCYEKIVNANSVSIANQFFSIEKLLLKSFQFVLPIKENSNTCSVRFATIIRESSNLFEIIGRKIYRQFFDFDQEVKIDIFNFLSLDVFLNFSKEELRSPTLSSYLGNNQKIEPFETLKSWNQQENLLHIHIPEWWKAYNKIKHDTESLLEYANLNNAIYSMAALFILIRKVYGEGLICGFLRKPSDTDIKETILYQIKASDIFIGEIIKTRGA